jgi:Alpha amylase, catalytic domain
MNNISYPSLYQVNTRIELTELGQSFGRPVTLDDIPDTALDRLAEIGFDWVWFLSVWQTGPVGRRISREHPHWQTEFRETLPDLCDEDIGGSGFAITAYVAAESLGGDAALARLRQRLAQRNVKLMLDFVPNHVGIDHPWVQNHPDYFVHGTEEQLAREPQNYLRVDDLILAHGRDPYFPGWPDTLQLDYSNPATQEAMLAELEKIARQCDGLRCDMAMLILPDVFERTWGRKPEPFWPRAIQRVRERTPEFCFMAEVYWDLEWTMQQQGFDYAYDKRLYDRLRAGRARPVREHFLAGLEFQSKLARFLENHDEARAAAVFPGDMHEAAAVITFCSPGLRFFHQGQFEGCLKRISPHLVRGPLEPANTALQQFYSRLLTTLREPILRHGRWKLLDCVPAWEGNGSWDNFIACGWEVSGGELLIVCVNYAAHPSQCYLRLPFAGRADGRWRLEDLMSEVRYDRDGNDLQGRGLYLDLPPWHYHVFAMKKRET